MGIPRDALHDAVESGRLERVMRGAYRMVGSGSSFTDELAAIWKLIALARLSQEGMRVSDWDGIAVGGSITSALLEIGDLHLSSYRLYAPRRINTRHPLASFARRGVAHDEVTFASGLPVTRTECAVFDLVVDDEDLSLGSRFREDTMMRSSRSRAKYAHAAGLGARRPRFRYIRMDRISLFHEVYSLAVVPVVVSPACQQAAQGHRTRFVCPVGTERRTNGGSASHATSGDCRTAQEEGDWMEEFDHEDAG